MKGILLAGGTASRLRPASLATNKQLMPIYDKPLIYYPLSNLMLMGISEILLITDEISMASYQRLFVGSKEFGVNIEFAVQQKPNGIAQAISIAEDFAGNESVCLILGDNFIYGPSLGKNLSEPFKNQGALIFAHKVKDPQSYGVVEFDEKGNVKSIVEKPENTKSDWAIPGVYCYDNSAFERVKSLRPSERNELEITDLNLSYLKDGMLQVKKFPRGTIWLDTGRPKDLLKASHLVELIQENQGILVGSPEEAAWNNGWIRNKKLIELAQVFNGTNYGEILRKIANDK